MAWSLLFYLAGCKDNPYREPVIEAPLALSEYNFDGMIELGTPVSGANITAYQFKGLVKGEKLAEVISSPKGSYSLKIKTPYDGPLLLVASGGLYRDLITGEMVAIKPGQELRSAITHIKMPEKTNINAWTTLAVARVQADRGFWDKSVAELKDIDRINVDFAHMSYFLTGKSPSFVNIRRQDFFDVANDAFKQEDPRIALHLAHGGLGKLASDFSASLAEAGIIVSVMDVILALADDLSDRIFDGHNASGNVVYIGKNNRITLSSYTMRKSLSEAILLYSKYLQGQGKLSEDDRIYLERPGRLIDTLARETQPELFPEAEKPKPIDKEAPVLKVDFAGASRGAPQFSFLAGNVSFDVEASDDTKVQEIKLLEPKVLTTKSGSAFGPIFVNHAPQAIYAAQVCGKESEIKAEIQKRDLSLANILCACFEATDIFGNANKELSCFQRAVLKSTISYPDNQTVLSSKSFKEGVKVHAYVSSGLPITECTWEIRARLDGEVDDGVLPSGQGTMDGTTCTVDEALDGAKFFNGSYYLLIQAKDLGERVLSDKQIGMYQSVVNFQVFKEPPAVEQKARAIPLF